MPATRPIRSPTTRLTGEMSLDASHLLPPVRSADGLRMGTDVNPAGESITVDSVSLLRNGKPWLPAMGEFHFSRYPHAEWQTELLKMKAGGIDLVSTYVFWIHHEEVQGQWNWEGDRDLPHFAELVQQAGLNLIVRIGPWCHGEVRHGGFPDWLLPLGKKLRTDAPEYLSNVERFYGQIAEQINPLLWKNGGPIVGIQIENEYHGHGQHLLTLKKIAVAAGLDVPLYTRTGWPALASPVPFGELLTLHGAYAEGFWDRSLEPMPDRYWEGFHFETTRADAGIATDHFGNRQNEKKADEHAYPFLTCELGGGMMSSYHRRIKIFPKDVESIALIKVGSGSNLPGYYMYHGGTNPPGQRSSMHEQQSTTFTNYNDLPERNYDFQAPLGQYGQVREHYHRLRRLHQFLRDFGPELTSTGIAVPRRQPADGDDTDSLRWAYRGTSAGGFIFVNNYQRLRDMPARESVRFELHLEGDTTLRVPAEPVTLPADACFFWPVNLPVGGATLVYATAQPFARVKAADADYVFFAAVPDVRTDFVFDRPVTDSAGHRAVEFHGVKPGRGIAFTIANDRGRPTHVVLLSDQDSLAATKVRINDQELIAISQAELFADGDVLRLRSTDASSLTVETIPAITVAVSPAASLANVHVDVQAIRQAGPPRTIAMSANHAAVAPTPAEFTAAAEWRLAMPADIDSSRDLLLRLAYVGDVARVYLGDELLTDDFYNGNPLEIGLARYGDRVKTEPLRVQILPVTPGAPIYFSGGRPAEGTVSLAVELIERHHAVARLQQAEGGPS